jgi:prephenate dehydrogenase
MPDTIAILGLGLLGGSIAAVARNKAGLRVVGWSQSESTRLKALERGITDASEPTPADAVREADLVVACTPVGAIPQVLGMIAGKLKPGAIVTDVGSTKRNLVIAGERILGAQAFVGSHPMAGSEKNGIDASNEQLLENRLCIVTPTERTPPEAADRVEAFWRSLGMRTTRVGPADHDRLLADVSHLPHLIASAVAALPEQRGLDVAGQGFRDVTRIAAGDAALWRDILMDNKESIIRSLDRLMANLRDYRTALQANDAGRIEAMLAAAAQRRREM